MLLKNARIINPETNLDKISDIRTEEDKIKEIGENLQPEGEEVIDLTGKTVTPGLVDMHCHLREPGFNAKETIKTGILSYGKYKSGC